MQTTKLKQFAQYARRSLIEQVSNKLKMVLAEDSVARRENPKAVEEIIKAISNRPSVISKNKETTDGCVLTADGLIEKVAYIWFNRFCALRFMDVNRYTRIGVVSPVEGQFQPEILAEAKMGHIDEGMVPDTTRQQIFALLDGTAPSNDPQSEAYRLLVVAICNFWHPSMLFMFERIADYTELLMPDDLLSGNSILAYTREAMTPDVCEDVEVIGWLYQFYISEKKDEVFAGLKKNRKITPENIPAATQLFTPHWIVKYLVENSLGRLWMLNRPGSKLVDKMEYYIRPDTSHQPSAVSNQQEEADGCTLNTDYLRVSSPEEIRICDPACGSGHMLTYAFDLLYAIYEEEGYEPAEIPEKILTQNLYGIEIDERAGELAAFALTMKARAKQRRFFRKQVQPNICVLENIQFGEDELKEYMDFIGRDLFTTPLQITLSQFEEADNFGSLIRPEVTDVEGMLATLEAKDVSGQLFLSDIHKNVLQALQQADYLSPKYHVVIANPPYMGGKGMNGRLGSWAKDSYPNSKPDLFAMFIERNIDLAQKHGSVAMITMQSWMFLSSFEAMRVGLLEQSTILSMAHLGARAFDSIGGDVVSTTAFVLENAIHPQHKGRYIRLLGGNSEAEKKAAIHEAIKDPDCGWFYRAAAADFQKLPGNPVAYWISQNVLKTFEHKEALISAIAKSEGKNVTTNNAKFIRLFWEISYSDIGAFDKKWLPCAMGGDYRKWFGNIVHTIDWSNNARTFYRKALAGRIIREEFWDLPGVTWGKIGSAVASFRFLASHEMYQETAVLQRTEIDARFLLGLLNSIISNYYLQFFSPTINFQLEDICSIPLVQMERLKSVTKENIAQLVAIGKADWNYNENSREFTGLSLLFPDNYQPALKATYHKLRFHWKDMTRKMQQLEEENNRIFIDAYGLQDELKPEVPLSEITLTCNPHYRYGSNKSEEELESLLLSDTMKEFISYAVGCMFGRYALEKPGLILANQGETIDDYDRKLQEPQIDTDRHRSKIEENNIRVNPCESVVQNLFPADDDNVIPMLDGDWFTDDITERFFKFLRITFSDEYFEENIRFIEQVIGKSIRKYFLKDFYSDHVKRYKKRPIYWLFSSPKGSFNALIYMHRYRPDTVSVVLNDYLREFRTKLTSRKNHLEAVSISASATQGEKTKALKEIEKLRKMIRELEDYEREVLYPLATEQVEIDLDDGVKVTYNKFGPALKKITGLSAK